MTGNNVSVPSRVWRARAPLAATGPRRRGEDDDDEDGGNEEERVKPLCCCDLGIYAQDGGFDGWLRSSLLSFLLRETQRHGGPSAADPETREPDDQVPGLQRDETPVARDLPG